MSGQKRPGGWCEDTPGDGNRFPQTRLTGSCAPWRSSPPSSGSLSPCRVTPRPRVRRSSKKSLAGTADTRATEASSSCPGSTSCTPPQPSARTRRRSSPVHVYFSTADLPHDADLHALREFKKELNAPYSTYSSSPDVASQVVHALEDDLPTPDSGPAPSPSVAAALDSSNSVSAPARAKLGVHHEHETQAIGTDKRGKMKYRHVVRDLVIDTAATPRPRTFASRSNTSAQRPTLSTSTRTPTMTVGSLSGT